MPNPTTDKTYRNDSDIEIAQLKKDVATLRQIVDSWNNRTSAPMPTQTSGRTAYVPPTPASPTPATTVITRTVSSGSTGSGTVGPQGPAGPSDRMSDAAILITTTPYDINPTDAKPQAYLVNVGASGSACVVNINVGMNSAGKKILLINGQRGGHFNKISVTCNQGTGNVLTDPLNYGGDSLDAVIVAIPTGNAFIAAVASTANSGTTSTNDGTSAGTPVPVQLRVQVMGIYHAEAATTEEGATPIFDSGEMMGKARPTATAQPSAGGTN